MIVPFVGLDLSLTSTGLATPNQTRVLAPPAKLRGLERLRWIHTRINRFIFMQPMGPGTFAVEGPSFGSTGRGQHERAGLWWRTVEYVDGLGFPVLVVPPTVVKKYATGKGNASKDEVLLAAARRFKWFKGGNDEADALWLCAIAAELDGKPIVDMPQSHRVDLADKVTRA